MFFYSPFIKYYREEVCNNFKADPIMAKVQQLQSRVQKAQETTEPLSSDADEREKRDAKTEREWMENEQTKFKIGKQGLQGAAKASGGPKESKQDIAKQISELKAKE